MRIVLFLLFLANANCYKILTFNTNTGKSHFEVFRPLMKEIINRKHELTLFSHYSLGLQHDNYTEKILPDISKRGLHSIDIFDRGNVKLDSAMLGVRMERRCYKLCKTLLSDKNIQELMQTTDSYDLIILEYFDNDCFFAIVDKFKIPVIGLSSTAITPWHNERFGNCDNPSYIPNAFYIYSNKMNFWERLENFLVLQFQKYYYNIFTLKNAEVLARECFNRKLTSVREMVANYSSLLLVNTHFSLNFARPLVPNIIEIGGIHIDGTKKLPENIEKFINESAHGVIYFSLGSMIKGHTFPQEKREEFLKAFSRLPQRVLWKWENETMPGKPENVMIQKWMPQFDILSHPNVKAFISHGGLLGTTEAVHCGVPMLVMPQYGDQHTNAKAVEANGGGVILYLKEATEEKVYQSLKKILEPEFRAKTKALSERFRDRPMSPMDTAIYWVEYVARHKGAPHMRTAAVDMPLYQYLLLDVIGFLAVILLAFVYITYKIASLILRAIFSKKKVKQN